MRNTGNTNISLDRAGNITGNKTGNSGNKLFSADLAILPFQPVTLPLAVAHPTFRPEATGSPEFIRLCPLRLRLVNAFLQDLGNRRRLPTFQPWPDHLLPRVPF